MNDGSDMHRNAAGTDEDAREDARGDGYPVAIAEAAARLRLALEGIESRALPLVGKIGDLSQNLATAESFKADRADLVSRLDVAKAEAREARAQLESREAEFARLADTTEREIAAIVTRVSDALGEPG